MTTLDLQVGASTDDAFEKDDDTGFDATHATIRVTSQTTTTSRIHTALRFTSVTVPNAATIDTAYIEFYATNTNADDANFVAYGIDTDNVATFTDVVNQPKTTASASFVQDGTGVGWYGSAVEIKSLVQEIVDRAGWSSGNAMGFLLWGNSDATKNFIAHSYDGSTTLCAKLHIEYTAGGETFIWPDSTMNPVYRM